MPVGNTQICGVCGFECPVAFKAELLLKHSVSYYFCKECGFLQTEPPTWLNEAYSEAIASEDTGLLSRNLEMRNRLTVVLYRLLKNGGKCLDYAGGYGTLTRLMNDSGFDFKWLDPYCKNLFAKGLEYKEGELFELVTAIEVMEHLADPNTLLDEVFDKFKASYFLFTTKTFEGDAAPDPSWDYYTFTTGQHVSFYQLRTLEKLATDRDLSFVSYKGLHLISRLKQTSSAKNLLSNSKWAQIWIALKMKQDRKKKRKEKC